MTGRELTQRERIGRLLHSLCISPPPRWCSAQILEKTGWRKRDGEHGMERTGKARPVQELLTSEGVARGGVRVIASRVNRTLAFLVMPVD